MANDHTDTWQGSPVSTETPNSEPIMLNAAGAKTVTVPHGPMLLNANFLRTGTDLHLTQQVGKQVIVHNFFSTESACILETEDGARITPDVAESLAGPDTLSGVERDATHLTQSNKPIGLVDTAEGGVFVTHTDGAYSKLNQGDPIYQGDVLETDDEGTISFTFVDSTKFALDEGGRMVLTEMAFDTQTGGGSLTLNIVQGVFSLVSGQVAKYAPDAMTVNTPVAKIGIRGTRISVKAALEDEEIVIALLQKGSGSNGDVSVTTAAGTRVMNQANQTAFIQSSAILPTRPSILPLEQLRSIFAEDSGDSRSVWRFEESDGERTEEALFEETIDEAVDEAKKGTAAEGLGYDLVKDAETAADSSDKDGADRVFVYDPTAGFGSGFGEPNSVLPDRGSTAFVDPVVRSGKSPYSPNGTLGADEISGGDGNDTSFGGVADNLVGGAGVDTLRISMTHDEFKGLDFQAEVRAYQANPGRPFHFDSINIDVESFEHLHIEVDGTIIVAEPPTLEVGNDYGTEDSAILLSIGASLNHADASEFLEVEVSGLPEGSCLHYIRGNGAAQSVKINDGESTVVISGETNSILDTIAVTPPEGDSKEFVIKVKATTLGIDGLVLSVSETFSVIINGIPKALPRTVSGY